MKSNLRLFALLMGVLISVSGAFAQRTWDDYVVEVKDDGNVVVIAPTGGPNAAPIVDNAPALNTIFHAIMGDTTETGERTNPDRTYETVPNGIYLYDGTAIFDATIPELVISAPPLNDTDVPPLHIKTTAPDGSFDKTFLQVNGSVYMENQYILMALTNNTLDREVMRAYGEEGSFYHFNNCVFEFTNWTCFFPGAEGQTFKFTNNLLLNIGAEANLEKGNFVDSWIVMDTLWFENNTIVNHGNLSMARPNMAPSFAYYNHNTIVNGTQNPFLYFSQAEMIATNNIIMNTGIVPDYPDFYPFNQDEDKAPKGIINADTLEQAWIDDHWLGTYPVADDADRKILAHKNNTFWDARFQDMFDNQLAAFPDTIDQTWNSQMINMNSRTQAMFDDDAAYPYFVEGTWYNVEPDFANLLDNVDEWVDFIVTNAIPGDPNGGNVTPRWRTNMQTELTTPDWPPLPDMSFTNAELIDGGFNGFPVGDLNWFPAEKDAWEATNESATLIAALKAGELPVDEMSIGDRKIEDQSVRAYPNPFSESTRVQFTLQNASDVKVVMYNVLGKKVLEVNKGFYSAGVHNVNLSKGDLKPGMYILKVDTGNNAGLTTKVSIK